MNFDDQEERVDPNGESMSLREQMNLGIPQFSWEVVNGQKVLWDNWLGEIAYDGARESQREDEGVE